MWDELTIETSVELDTSDLDKANSLASLDYFSDALRDTLDDITNDITERSETLGEKLSQRAKSLQELMIGLNGTIGHGDLLNSITVESNGENSYLVGTNITHFYPLVVEKGRTAVEPVSAPFLQWQNLDGSWVRTKYSRPFSGKPYVEPSYNHLTSELDEIIDEVFGGL